MNEINVALTVTTDSTDQSPVRLEVRSGRPEDTAPIEILALVKAIDRLEGAVEAETESLRVGSVSSFEDFNYRKSHGLLELTRAMRAIRPEQVGGWVRERLSGLRTRLEGNRVLLKTHLDATREISQILTTAARESESDGTYSAGAGLRGAVR